MPAMAVFSFAQKDYESAQADFAAALEHNPSDVTSINNTALCLMYQRDLMGATRYLEVSQCTI
jgi:Tfp pilus assembly protein PilF